MAKIKKRSQGKSGHVEIIDIDTIAEYLSTIPEESSIYIGCDSRRYRKKNVWYADYGFVVIVHVGAKKGEHGQGCKLFGSKITEKDYGDIFTRLFRETELAGHIYKQVKYVAGDRYMEIHLDINEDPKCGSNVVMKAALGYIRGMYGIDAKIKPNAPAASCASDCLASKAMLVKQD